MVQGVEAVHPFNDYPHDGKRLKGFNGHAYPSLPELSGALFSKHDSDGRDPPLNMHLAVMGNESGLGDPNGMPHSSDLTRSTSQSCRSHPGPQQQPCGNHHQQTGQQQMHAPPPPQQQAHYAVPPLPQTQGHMNPAPGNGEKAPTSASETSQTSPLPLQLMPINTNNHHMPSQQYSVDTQPQYSAPVTNSHSYGPAGSREQMPMIGNGGSQGGWASQNAPMGVSRPAGSMGGPSQGAFGAPTRSISGTTTQGGMVKGASAASALGEPPCAACKSLRRKCTTDCLLLPYFPRSDPDKFAHVHKVFGASNVTKILQALPPHQREDAVSSLEYEARARVEDPVYGCVGIICILQREVASLQAQLAECQGNKQPSM